MISLECIKKLNLQITWRLLYIGVLEQQISTEDVIDYAIDRLSNDSSIEVCELAGLNANESETMRDVLWHLVEQEKSNHEFEFRKLRAAIVSNTLKVKKENYLDGLMELTDMWIGLGYPSDSPHIIQGHGNNMSPKDYYTAIRDIVS